MIVSNFMLLNKVHPHEVYNWFICFALDSYDWVMIQNVYSMGQYADGGLTTRRPYISSSAYILKMSDYKKEDWCETWDELFKKFLKDNKTKLKHTIYARK